MRPALQCTAYCSHLSCSRPGQECQDCGEEGRTCSQQYSGTRLQVFGDNRRDLVWEQFLFPSNCTCTPDNKTNNL